MEFFISLHDLFTDLPGTATGDPHDREAGDRSARHHTVTPWIIARGAGGLVSFIEKTFGGKRKRAAGS